MNQLQTVHFYGDEIAAMQDGNGHIMVSVRHVCDSLGIDTTRQITKLRGYKWSTLDEMSTVAADGKVRTMTMIDIESIPLWMTTIRPGKVSPQVATKLERYQLEAKQVLANHFLKPQSVQPVVDPILAMLESATATRKAQIELERRQSELEVAIDQVDVHATLAYEKAQKAEYSALAAQETVTGAADYMALVGFCRLKGIKKTEQELSSEGKRFTKFCRSKGINIKPIPHQKFGYQNAYDVQALENHWWPDYCQRNNMKQT